MSKPPIRFPTPYQPLTRPIFARFLKACSGGSPGQKLESTPSTGFNSMRESWRKLHNSGPSTVPFDGFHGLVRILGNLGCSQRRVFLRDDTRYPDEVRVEHAPFLTCDDELPIDRLHPARQRSCDPGARDDGDALVRETALDVALLGEPLERHTSLSSLLSLSSLMRKPMVTERLRLHGFFFLPMDPLPHHGIELLCDRCLRARQQMKVAMGRGLARVPEPGGDGWHRHTHLYEHGGT